MIRPSLLKQQRVGIVFFPVKMKTNEKNNFNAPWILVIIIIIIIIIISNLHFLSVFIAMNRTFSI